MFIPVKLNCNAVTSGDLVLNIGITPYAYAPYQPFKGVIHVHHDFDQNGAFEDSCEMIPGTSSYTVSHSSSSTSVDCDDQAVSKLGEMTIYLEYKFVNNIPIKNIR